MSSISYLQQRNLPPLPVIVDNEEEWYVEQILDSRIHFLRNIILLPVLIKLHTMLPEEHKKEDNDEKEEEEEDDDDEED
ncbi:hypothetical protein EV426DRAFT_700355 [Tirmania nivea]|nr:hypothetical protein EV426DRAFT_700355 [Tirmania nivea]